MSEGIDGVEDESPLPWFLKGADVIKVEVTKTIKEHDGGNHDIEYSSIIRYPQGLMELSSVSPTEFEMQERIGRTFVRLKRDYGLQNIRYELDLYEKIIRETITKKPDNEEVVRFKTPLIL